MGRNRGQDCATGGVPRAALLRRTFVACLFLGTTGTAALSAAAETAGGAAAQTQAPQAPRGFIGVAIQPVTAELAQPLGLDRPRGVLVGILARGAPAEIAGIERGDVLLRYGATEIADVGAFQRASAALIVGEEIEVTLLRRGKERTVRVRVVAMPEGGAASAYTGRPDDDVPRSVFGLEVAPLTDALRARYGIAANVRGLAITAVDPALTSRQNMPVVGEVIVELERASVSLPGEFQRLAQGRAAAGKRATLLLVATPAGELRYVALPVR